jgi:hypothetical protein
MRRSCCTAICTRSFSERDTAKRWAAIERTYHEDVRFIDPEGEVVGDFVLEEDGPGYIGSDTAAMPWRFGPPGSPLSVASTFLRCETAV